MMDGRPLRRAVPLGLDRRAAAPAIGHTVIAGHASARGVIALFAPPLGRIVTALLVGLVIDLACRVGRA